MYVMFRTDYLTAKGRLNKITNDEANAGLRELASGYKCFIKQIQKCYHKQLHEN